MSIFSEHAEFCHGERSDEASSGAYKLCDEAWRDLEAKQKSLEQLDAISGSLDIHNLPLGDGQVLSDPEKLSPGNVLVSPELKERLENAPRSGAIVDGPWINNETQTYDLSKKIQAPGEIYHDSEYSNTFDHVSNTRRVSGNALPSTPTGNFPIDRGSEAGKIDPNPNHIETQYYTVTLPGNPKPADAPVPLPMGATAILNTGALLYSPLDGNGNDAVAHEIQDDYDGHASEQQEYHVHNVPPELYENQNKTGPAPVLGRALDGYPIVAAFNSEGALYSSDELDRNHGKMTWVQDEEGNLRYQWAYCVSLDYPYTMSSFKGEPAKINYSS